MITYCMFQEIHHQTLSIHQRHQSIFSDHVSCPQRPSQKQSEIKYPMFEVIGLGTTNPSKSLQQTLHSISNSL